MGRGDRKHLTLYWAMFLSPRFIPFFYRYFTHQTFWPDLGTTQVIDGEEFDWGAKNNTDCNHGPCTGTLLHAWWADSKQVADEIYQDHTKFTQYQQAEKQHAGWVDAVYVSKNDHYHVGKANIIVNGS